MTRGANWRRPMWGAGAALLLLPLAAMAVTEQVNWGAGDFVTFAAMLGALGLGVEAAMRLTRGPLRPAAILLLGLAFALVWVELAVGILH